MNGILIATENVPRIWELVKPVLAKAVDAGNGEFDIDDVGTELFAGIAQLWVGYNADLKLRMVATTKIEVWPKVRRMRIELMAGGGLDDFFPLFPMVEAWGKEHGCTETVAAVRPGMRKRLVKELGFRPGFETVIRGIA